MEPKDLIPWLSAPGAIALWKVGEWVIARFIKKVDATETALKKAEESKALSQKANVDRRFDELLSVVREVKADVNQVKEKVDSLEAGQLDMRHEIKRSAERQSQIEGSLKQVSERIDGMSRDYGPKITDLKESVARLDERLKMTESRRRR